ncbi:MAG: TolB family protein [Armatimonadota bacterium]
MSHWSFAIIMALLLALPLGAQPAGTGGDKMGLKLVETDAETGAEIYCLGADERPADNIYGEQPYGDPTGRRIAIRYYKQEGKPGSIEILDLVDGSRHVVLTGKPPFPAFNGWGEWLYYAQTVDGKRMLRRCNFLSLKVEDVAELPAERGGYSYGTVSEDGRYYAVAVTPPAPAGEPAPPARVDLLDTKTGQWSIMLDKPGYHAKHEQFSRDGRNRVLIQLNQVPGVKVVLLSELEIGGGEKGFPADQPYTLRPTGHESWIGNSSDIFFSTGSDGNSKGNIWRGKVGDKNPTLVYEGKKFGHISVSKDGKYWIGDTGEEGIPIYIGSFATGKAKRLCFSRTEYDGQQWSHAHPYLTADNKWLVFGARRNGHPQCWGAKLKDGWLAGL